jgi:hypothetical protein
MLSIRIASNRLCPEVCVVTEEVDLVQWSIYLVSRNANFFENVAASLRQPRGNQRDAYWKVWRSIQPRSTHHSKSLVDVRLMYFFQG